MAAPQNRLARMAVTRLTSVFSPAYRTFWNGVYRKNPLIQMFSSRLQSETASDRRLGSTSHATTSAPLAGQKPTLPSESVQANRARAVRAAKVTVSATAVFQPRGASPGRGGSHRQNILAAPWVPDTSNRTLSV